MGLEDDRQSVKTMHVGPDLHHNQTEMNTLVRNNQVSDVRSEYSGIRGGGRGNSKYGPAKPLGAATISAAPLNSAGQPIIRANTIHRALVGQNQLMKQKGKKRGVATRKSHVTNGTASVSLKTEIRATHAGGSTTYAGQTGAQDMSRIYSTSSQQPQRSHAVNSRGAGSSVSGTASNVSGSINSRQFAQVRLRADLSVQSQQKRSPNRYANTAGSAINPLRAGQQQTIQYNKNDESSLVTENRNRNLIGNSLNRPHVQPIDPVSVTLNANFANKARMQSVNASGSKVPSQQHISSQFKSISRGQNPLDSLQQEDANHGTLSPLKHEKNASLVRNRDNSQTSQRSFRIRKGYVRSISRGSNCSKLSNLTQDNDLKRPDTAKKTIEHPTDVEDADDHGVYDDPSDFDHINNSPDIKLRSIEVDEDITGRRHKTNAAAADSDGKSEADDNSGTGHRVTSSKKSSPSLASSEVLKLRLEKNKAVELIKNMKHSFLKFKQRQEEI